MATTKAKTTSKSSAKKSAKSTKTAASKPAKTVKVEEKVGVITSKPSGNPVKEFFGRKYDADENILTIFKSPRIIGAALGELIGTMLLTMIFLTLGFNPLYLPFAIIAITIAVFAFSGANLNPAITVGMMASRRMSPIRGTLYIIAQVLGAWFGLLVINAFRMAGGGTNTLPTLEAPLTGENSMFWPVIALELVGAIIIGFCFARALVYKRSVFTFGAMVSGGICLAILLALVISNDYLGLSGNVFVMNPAVSIMFQSLSSEAAEFGPLMADIGRALTVYAVFPLIGGVIGFYLSDLSAKLSGSKLAE